MTTVAADLVGLDQQIHTVRVHLARLLEDHGRPRTIPQMDAYCGAVNSAQARLDALEAQREALT